MTPGSWGSKGPGVFGQTRVEDFDWGNDHSGSAREEAIRTLFGVNKDETHKHSHHRTRNFPKDGRTECRSVVSPIGERRSKGITPLVTAGWWLKKCCNIKGSTPNIRKVRKLMNFNGRNKNTNGHFSKKTWAKIKKICVPRTGDKSHVISVVGLVVDLVTPVSFINNLLVYYHGYFRFVGYWLISIHYTGMTFVWYTMIKSQETISRVLWKLLYMDTDTTEVQITRRQKN